MMKTKQKVSRRYAVWSAAAGLCGLMGLIGGISGCGSGKGTAPSSVSLPESGPNVRAVVENVQTQTGVPALAGAYITVGSIRDWASGIRQADKSSTDPTNIVGQNDLFQVNSNLKAATSTLAARLVEEGKIRFDATPGQLFPDLASEMNPQLRDVTLEQLLDHRAGVVPIETLDELNAFGGGLRYDGTPRQQRLAFVRDALKNAPASPIGEFHYSNGGYAVAGAMLEAAANQDFADLMQQKLFGPLGTTYHSGYPRDTNPQEPIGHVEDSTVFTPLDASVFSPPALEPAGIASLTTHDYALFVQQHLRGVLGQTTLLRPETMTRLHTPLPTGQPNELGGPQSYAFGWEEVTLDGVRTIVHYGSDDTYFSVAIIQPTRGMAAYAVSNAGGERGYNAVNEAATKLLGIANPFPLPSTAPPTAASDAARSVRRVGSADH